MSTQCGYNESGGIPFVVEIVSDNAHSQRIERIEEETKHQNHHQQQELVHANRHQHHHHHGRRHRHHRRHNSHEILMLNNLSTATTTCAVNNVDSHHHVESRWECSCSSDFELSDSLPHHPVGSCHNTCTTLKQRQIHHKKKNKTTTNDDVVVMKRSASDSRLKHMDLTFLAARSAAATSSTTTTTTLPTATKSFPGGSKLVPAPTTTKSKCCYDHFTEFNSSECWNHHLHHDMSSSSSSSSPLTEPPKLPIRTVTPTRALTSLLVTHHDDVLNGDEISPTTAEMRNEEFANGNEIAGVGRETSTSSSRNRTLMTIRSVLGVLAPGSSEQQVELDGNDELTSPSPPAAATMGEKRGNPGFSFGGAADATLSSSMREIIYHQQHHYHKKDTSHRHHQYLPKQQQELPNSLRGTPYEFDN